MVSSLNNFLPLWKHLQLKPFSQVQIFIANILDSDLGMLIKWAPKH